MNNRGHKVWGPGWLITAILIVAALCSLWALYEKGKTERSERNSIERRASTAAAVINADRIKRLSGTLADIGTEDYEVLKNLLSNIAEANPEVRFAYLMGYAEEAGKMFFFVDSEPAYSPDISLPGDIYEETTEEELIGFLTGASFVEGPYADQWGTWVSGFGVIKDDETGQTLALLGLDIDASLWQRHVSQSMNTPIIVAIFIILTLVFMFRYVVAIQKAERLKSELVSLASHQLSNPLTGIRWYAESLIQGDAGTLTEKQAEYAKLIASSAAILIKIVNNFLNLGRLEGAKNFVIKKENTDIVKIIDLTIKDLVSIAEQNRVKIAKDPDFPGQIVLSADREKIYDVFNNIISNAVKYAKPDTEVLVSAQDKGDSFVFSVRDKGVGIPAADQPRIFRKFFRAGNIIGKTAAGSGLGLYLAREIIVRHGGQIWFESEEGKGTTFFFSLPK